MRAAMDRQKKRGPTLKDGEDLARTLLSRNNTISFCRTESEALFNDDCDVPRQL
jgi:hypothetical protein